MLTPIFNLILTVVKLIMVDNSGRIHFGGVRTCIPTVGHAFQHWAISNNEDFSGRLFLFKINHAAEISKFE